MDTCDSQALLLEEDDQRDTYLTIKGHITNILRYHFKLFVLVCDVFCVIIFSLFLVSKNAMLCHGQDETLEWCQPYVVVDKVIVDFNMELADHCTEPRACVAYAELLATSKGFNTNFMLGDKDLVYVGKGYQCNSDVLRIEMIVFQEADPTSFQIPEEVLVRYSEIIYEGLRCGLIHSNYTTHVTFTKFGVRFNETDEMMKHTFWHKPQSLALLYKDRQSWRERPHGNHPFLAFDINRIYSSHQRLQACDDTVPDTEA